MLAPYRCHRKSGLAIECVIEYLLEGVDLIGVAACRKGQHFLEKGVEREQPDRPFDSAFHSIDLHFELASPC